MPSLRFLSIGLLCSITIFSTAGSLRAAQQPAAARGWDTALSLPAAPDLNPDARILEINLEASVAQVEIAPGRRVEAWTYNGGLPGPLIRLRVGDRLIVHFTNRLPAATTVHWHGLRIPIQMDGVPDHSQPEVKPGESFTYDFIVPDAGLYWYHPHVMSAAQVGFGLYGAFLVDDPAEEIAVAEEHVLVLSDIDLTAADRLEAADTGGSAGMAFGREGNVVLVNGRNHPRVSVRTGVPQRWRIVNAAKSRYFEFDPGEGQRFTKIGGDGGLQEYATEHEFLVLAPGERADVFITPRAAPGAEIAVGSRLFDRGYGSVEGRLGEQLFTMVMADAPAPATPMTLPTVTRPIAPVDQAGAVPIAIEFGISQAPGGAFNYTINGKRLGQFKPVQATVGDTQIWTITNPTPWSHPFHLHGFFFQVLDTNGEPTRPLAWKDTVSVPFKGSVRLIVRYDDRPGMWMFHCHILDHADGGLMGTVQLSRPGETAEETKHAH